MPTVDLLQWTREEWLKSVNRVKARLHRERHPDWYEKHRAYYAERVDSNPRYVFACNLYAGFKMRLEEWDQRICAQSGLCDMCEQPMVTPRVDHSHTTGKVRAILCNRCNVGLSYIEDAEFAARAAAYLERMR